MSGNPRTAVALRGTNMTLNCSAFSSSDSPMTASWRKDREVLYEALVLDYTRYQDQQIYFTSVLHLLAVNFTDEGQYQCVIFNHFGSNYSTEAKLTVNGELRDEILSSTCKGFNMYRISTSNHFSLVVTYSHT